MSHSHRSKSSKRSKSKKHGGSRSSRVKRAMKSRHLSARIECLKKGMVSFKRKGKIHCRKSRGKIHLSRHQSRYAPTEFDYLKSKTVKKLKKLAKSKHLKTSGKKKLGLIRSILQA